MACQAEPFDVADEKFYFMGRREDLCRHLSQNRLTSAKVDEILPKAQAMQRYHSYETDPDGPDQKTRLTLYFTPVGEA